MHTTTPSPSQNTPFPGLNLKVGKTNYCLGNLDPNWAKSLKNGQNMSRSGQKQIIHHNLKLGGEGEATAVLTAAVLAAPVHPGRLVKSI